MATAGKQEPQPWRIVYAPYKRRDEAARRQAYEDWKAGAVRDMIEVELKRHVR